MSKYPTFQEALSKFRENRKEIRRVFQEEAEDPAIDQDKAQQIAELLEDGKSLIADAIQMMDEVSESSDLNMEDVIPDMDDLRGIPEKLESVTAMVKQNGGFDTNSDPTSLSPDEKRSPRYQEDDEDDAPIEPVRPEETEPQSAVSFSVAGVEDQEELNRRIQDIVAELGGVLQMSESVRFSEDATAIYTPVGQDTKLKDGEDPNDEYSRSDENSEEMLKNLQNKGAQSNKYHLAESRMRQRFKKPIVFKMTEGVRRLISKNRQRKPRRK